MNFLSKYSKKPDSFLGFLFWNFFFAYLPLSLLIAILTLMYVAPVNFNDEKYYGIQGVVIVILYIPFVTGTMALLNWIFLLFGNFVLRSVLSLSVHEKKSDE